MIEDGMGLTLDFPFTPALDMAGVVEAVGDDVVRFGVGDRVVSNFLPGWIDGQPGGSAASPSYRTLDHVLDLVGGANFARSVATVAVGGRISVIRLLDGAELTAPTVPILLKTPVIQGIVTGHRRALEDLVRAVDRIGLKPVVDRKYPFTELRPALEHLAAGAFGKLVIDVTAH